MIADEAAKVVEPETEKTEESMDDSEVEIEEVTKQTTKSTWERSTSQRGAKSEPIRGLEVSLMIAAKKSQKDGLGTEQRKDY